LIYRLRFLLALLLLSACAEPPASFRATVAPTQVGAGAPIYSPTPTFTLTPTITPSLTPSITPSLTPTRTPTPTTTPSPTLTPTTALLTLTPPSSRSAPHAELLEPAGLAATAGWSCDDFPCEDDLAGFMERIRVPPGYQLEHLGQFPGQPMQIVYGPDGRLYATVLENGATRSGAVYAMAADGTTTRYAGDFYSPVGLAFQPGTSVLYLSSRRTPMNGGVLWRILPGEAPEAVIDDLPCCFQQIDNQPNGLIFGPDGYLYLAVAAVTDHDESSKRDEYAPLQPYEASILRIQPHTGEIEVYAQGLRDPYDLGFNSQGQFYATDQGLVSGIGDRLLAITPGDHYGWPYWRTRGCDACPPRPSDVEIAPDLVSYPAYSAPRGLAVYTGSQFPANLFDAVFVALWNGGEEGQRVLVYPPIVLAQAAASGEAPVGEAFVTGLIRPVDLTVAPDGSLVVADFIYGHIWRVRYVG
jgi:glucose/arabinose dehydrogenase